MRLEESEHFELMQYVRSLSLLYGTIPLLVDSHHNSDRAFRPSAAGLDDTGVAQDTVPGIVCRGYFGNFRSV